MNKYDIIIVGGGPGGYVAAIRAAQLGFKTAVIEKDAMGGVCLNWGCIPTKALLKSAKVYKEIVNAETFGIKVEGFEPKLKKMMERSQEVAEKMSKGVSYLMKKNKVNIINGYGWLKSNKKIEVTNAIGEVQLYEADHIVIATGGRAKQLENIAVNNQRVLDYMGILSLKKAPKNLIVVGAGAIGIEFASFFNALGSNVTILEYTKHILPNEDEDVSKELEKILKNKGINIITEAAVQEIEHDDENPKIRIVKYKHKEEIKEVDANKVLIAVGVSANVENMGLEEVGITLEKGVIKVNKNYQTNINGYYAIGDVIGNSALAHVASAEGIHCIEHIAGKNPPPIDYMNIPYCTYSFPEVASVGITEKKAKSMGYDIKVGKFPFSASGKAAAVGETSGFVKLVFDKKYGELLGAHLLGENVTELISELVLAKKMECTAKEILHSIHPHPTFSEAIMEAAGVALDEGIHI